MLPYDQITISTLFTNGHELYGLDWIAPDYSTLCRRQKHIDIAIRYKESRGGLHLFDEWIDSVYTDGAYDKKYCRQVISDRQA